MPGVPQPWKHGRGPERRLSRRATRSSNHIGHCAAGPSGSEARRSPVACVSSTSSPCAWHRPQLEVVSKHSQLPRQSDRREPLLGGNVGERGPTEADEVGHSPLAEGGSRVSSSKTDVSGGKPNEAAAYPTDRVLGGEEPSRRRSKTRTRTQGEVLVNVSRCPVETSGAREVRVRAESGVRRVIGGNIEGSRKASAVEGGLHGARIHGPIATVAAGGHLPSPRDPARFSPTRAARVGCLVHRDARIPACFGARQVARLLDSAPARETLRGFSPSWWQHRRGFRRTCSFLQKPCGDWHAPPVKLCT
jgi:hypothetical protein